MKTEQQIRQWAKSHTVHENDVHAIMGYLTALNFEIYNDIEFNLGAKKECFDSFVDWFESDILSDYKKANELFRKIMDSVITGDKNITFEHIPDNSNIKPKFRGIEPDYTLLLRLESEKETETHKGVIDAFVKELEKTRKEYDNTLYGSIQGFNGSVTEALNQTATGMYKLVNDLKKGGGLFYKDSVKPTPEHKYKVGDWVRHYEDGLFVVKSLLPYNAYFCESMGNSHFKSLATTENHLEPATPKEGEFWRLYDLKDNCYFIVNEVLNNDYLGYSYCEENKVVLMYYMHDSYLVLSRPATSEEKQQLIKAVEDKYNKTWNGTEWVDCFKKGDYVVQNKSVRIYLDTCTHINGLGEIGKDSNIPSRYASILESKAFDISLNSIGKLFNPKTLELEEILKVGDMVIYYDTDNKADAKISILHKIYSDRLYKYQVTGSKYLWECAIKFTSER